MRALNINFSIDVIGAATNAWRGDDFRLDVSSVRQLLRKYGRSTKPLWPKESVCEPI